MGRIPGTFDSNPIEFIEAEVTAEVNICLILMNKNKILYLFFTSLLPEMFDEIQSSLLRLQMRYEYIFLF